MLKKKVYDYRVAARNMPKAKLVLGVEKFGIYKITEMQLAELGLTNMFEIECVCERCGKDYLLGDNKRASNCTELCQSCRIDDRQNKMRATLKTDACIKRKSEAAKTFEQTERGKIARQLTVSKRNVWLETDAGKEHLQICGSHLKHKYGPDHPNWNPNRPEQARYTTKVHYHTRRQPLHLLENSDKLATCGTDGGYQIDHMLSVSDGYAQGIPFREIAHIANLTVVPWKENLLKRNKSSIDYPTLLARIQEYETKSINSLKVIT